MLSVLINTHMLMAAKEAGVERFFYSSSACVYNADKQTRADVDRAQGRGRLSRHAGGRLRLGEAVQRADVPPLPRGLRPRRPASPATTTSTAPTAHGTAAARRRRPRSAARSSRPSCRGEHEIEIWGDGKQTRSFMYIDDCIEGTHPPDEQRHPRAAQPRQRRAGHHQPAGRHRRRDRRREAQARTTTSTPPRACNGRNSDNTLIKKLLGWAPSVRLATAWRRPTTGSTTR